MKIKNIYGIIFDIELHGDKLADNDIEYIKNYNDTIYHNDVNCYLWAFDCKMTSGRLLENIRFSNDMKTATAVIL